MQNSVKNLLGVLALTLLCANAHSDDPPPPSYETVVYGTAGEGTISSPIDSVSHMNMLAANEAFAHQMRQRNEQWARQAQERRARIEQCQRAAATAAQTCDNAITDLNRVCNAYVGTIGVLSAARLLAVVGVAQKDSIMQGLTAVGAHEIFTDGQMPGCGYLHNEAKAYCAKGVAQMESNCT